MFTLLQLEQPETLEDAYRILTAQKSNTLLGGCAFLRLGNKRIGKGIDLSKLNLDYVLEKEGFFEIGAFTSLRAVETHPTLKNFFNGVIGKSLSNIIGVQFRNAATVGGSVFARYGFSDFLTALLALDTKVELHKAGLLPLAEFLQRPFEKDILTKILINKENRNAAYHCLRHSASDFPILNVAVSKLGNQWAIAVGARPHRARLAHKAALELRSQEISLENIENAASTAAEELSFGSNARGSAEYRRAVCQVLVRRAITEVLQCK